MGCCGCCELTNCSEKFSTGIQVQTLLWAQLKAGPAFCFSLLPRKASQAWSTVPSTTAAGLFFRHCGSLGHTGANQRASHFQLSSFHCTAVQTHVCILLIILGKLLFSGAVIIPNKIFRKQTQRLTFINLPFLAEEGFKRPETTHYQFPLQAPQLSLPLLKSALILQEIDTYLAFSGTIQQRAQASTQTSKRRATGFFEIIHEILHLLSTLLGHLTKNKEQ